ncbi:hypothetical protein [Deinococcus sp.]|uniref:TapB family protein n=1 Tax=Deinococcus sp. TaxID=47478 RepID=UPI0025D71C5B|nr:hypothetical protein [Deinococcus sp.]
MTSFSTAVVASVLASILTLGGSALGAVAPAAPGCENALNPAENWTWQYQKLPTQQAVTQKAPDPKAPGSYDLRRVVAQSGFSDEYRTGGKVVFAQQYRCQNGAHSNVSKLDFGAGVTITRIVSSGQTTPPPAAWKVGHTWSQVFDLEGRKGLLSGTGRIASNYRVLGREQVTVPAGTFGAWKVAIETTFQGKLGPIQVMNSKRLSTSWYAEGTGLIRTEEQDGVTELQAIRK